MVRKKQKGVHSSKIWLLISFSVAMLFWYYLSISESTARSFPNILLVWKSIFIMLDRGVLLVDLMTSLWTILCGFLVGLVLSIPNAIIMAWYIPYQKVVSPWLHFIRNIPPLAYVPLVVLSAGVGFVPQVIVISIATFLTMTITIFQGIIHIDPVLIQAAKVLGASDVAVFQKVLIPASIPFLVTAIRLGVGVALTTLIAAESTGAIAGLGMRIRSLNNTFDSAPLLLYIIIIGLIGLIIDKCIDGLEKRLTVWQEKKEM
ncbi:ABC transporter permease [Streptococcus sp. ZJ93]|uniref:ABC transporter permease n=1 Tax=Streptococcus handemini TaxID=3161188 RepID=UPI0032EADC5D